MADTAAVHRRACAQNEHQDHQGRQNELNVLLLNFRNSGCEMSSQVFHRSPFVNGQNELCIDYPATGYKGDYKISV